MDLNILWFVLIAVLFSGYFVLEGFDFGVGILLPFLGKDNLSKRQIINTIGPHWDGNEVWLITAGGAMFAAFPHWYATLFSGFYLPLFIILIALIFRGVAFEFRHLDDHPAWQNFWEWAIFGGSLVPALLWGVAFSNLLIGIPIDASMNYVGGFWNLLNPYALLGGLVTLAGFTLHGAIFLTMKVSGPISDKAQKFSRSFWIVVGVLLVAFGVFTILKLNLFAQAVSLGSIALFACLAAYLAAGWLLFQKRTGWAFILTTLTILLGSVTFFGTIYPNVLISSLNPVWNLTLYTAASGTYTLKTMAIVALIFVPIVLLYQGGSYWVFRKRITTKKEDLQY